MAKAGRRYKLTPEVSARICEGVRLRMGHKHAAIRAGVSQGVFYKWMQAGEKLQRQINDGEQVKPTPYEKACLQFVEDVTRAISDGQAALLAMVHQGARDDWRAASWILERRHPYSFSKRHFEKLQENKDESITVVFHRPTMEGGGEPESDDIGADLSGEPAGQNGSGE